VADAARKRGLVINIEPGMEIHTKCLILWYKEHCQETIRKLVLDFSQSPVAQIRGAVLFPRPLPFLRSSCKVKSEEEGFRRPCSFFQRLPRVLDKRDQNAVGQVVCWGAWKTWI
jgi:hypothetical protein